MKSLRHVLLALLGAPLLIATAHAAPESDAAPAEEASSTSEVPELIVLVGDDPALVASVADELTAAGFKVVIEEPVPEDADPAFVAIASGDDVIDLEVVRPDATLRTSVERERSAGMNAREATAIRIAETVRSLVTADVAGSDTDDTSPAAGDDAGAPATSAEDDDGAADTPAPSPEPQLQIVLTTAAADGDSMEVIATRPRFRLGARGGVGFSNLVPSGTAGITLRGQVSRWIGIVGTIEGMHSIDDARPFGEGHRDPIDMWGGDMGVMVEWDMLGSDNAWTPTLGLGARAGYRAFDTHHGRYDDLLTYYRNEPEGQALTAGPVLALGLTFGKPFRFRFDVRGDVTTTRVDLDGQGHDTAIPLYSPSAYATLGFDIDFGEVAIMAPKAQTASR